MTFPSPSIFKRLSERVEQCFKKIIVLLLRVLVVSKKLDLGLIDSINNILVVRQHDQLGDMLCAVPLLRALKTRFPKASITLVASSVNYEIMLNHPYLNKVVCYNKTKLWKFYRELRSINYDLAIVPATVSVSMTSDLIAFLSRARIRIGAASLIQQNNPTSFCFTTGVDLNWQDTPHRHQALRNLDILKPLNYETSDDSCIIGLNEEEKKQAEKLLTELRTKYKILIGIHPGAGKPENRWRAEYFASLANQLSNEYHAGIIITTGPMDEKPLSEIKQYLNCPFELIQNYPLRLVAAIINQIDLFITNDTGIMHVAGATRSKLLALFGPTDPLQWAPIGKRNCFINAKDGNINSISVDEVKKLALILLQEESKINLND